MQQPLGDKVKAMDPSLLRGLFLQQLPSNVGMIMVSTAKGNSLQELTEMANGMMEVISLSISTVATPQGTEIKELKAEVTSLWRQLSDLLATGQRRSNSRKNRRTRSQSRSPSQSVVCLYCRHFRDSAQKCHISMQAGKRSGQRLRATSTAGHIQSRLFYNRPHFRTKIPDRHVYRSQCGTTFTHTSENPKQGSQPAGHQQHYNSDIWHLLATTRFGTLPHI